MKKKERKKGMKCDLLESVPPTQRSNNSAHTAQPSARQIPFLSHSLSFCLSFFLLLPFSYFEGQPYPQIKPTAASAATVTNDATVITDATVTTDAIVTTDATVTTDAIVTTNATVTTDAIVNTDAIVTTDAVMYCAVLDPSQ